MSPPDFTFFFRYFPDEGDPTVGYHEVLAPYLGEARHVLDLGCGDNADLADYRAPGRTVWGADFQFHPRLHDPEWFCLLDREGRAPFPEGTFDVIAARWVLEHVRRPKPFLDEVARLLRPGGTFVALTIYAGHYATWISRLMHRLPHRWIQGLVRRLYGRADHDTFPAWYRLNVPGRLARAAADAGLQPLEWQRYANPGYFSFSGLLWRGAVVADYLLERAGTGLGRLYFVVTLHKPGGPGQSGLPSRVFPGQVPPALLRNKKTKRMREVVSLAGCLPGHQAR
jgi:SAM-dependent methyltransferase